MGSFSLSGGVEVTGFISPTDSNDTYPVIDPLYGIDGFRNVNLLSDLNSIPELRRRAGMVVGVSGGTTYYKLNPSPWNYNISDWSIFNSGGGGGTVTGDYLPLSGGTVTGNTVFSSGLTANTISATSMNLTTIDLCDNNGIIYSSNFSGCSPINFYSDSIFNSGLTANTISATTYLNLPIDLTITGISYSNNTLTITNNSGNTLSTNINSFTGLTINGILSATTISGGTLFGDGSNLTGIITQDTFVTGGTYSAGTATFTNNTGGTFNVVGFYTGATDVFVTGGTYSAGTATFTNNTGGTFTVTGFTTGGTSNISGDYLPLSGGTVTGNTTFTLGLSATTISATTYQNLPTDVFVTGGTYSNGSTTFTNNTGGTFNVTGFYTGQTSYVNSLTTGTGLSGNSTTGNITLVNTAPDQIVTISGGTNIQTGGTYPNFSIAVTGLTDNNRFVTGFTYDDANTFTISDNSGSTYSATFNYVTGLTATTISAFTYQNLPIDVFVTGGTYSASTATFTNVTGGTFNVTGFSDFQYFISGSSPSGITLNVGDRWYNLNNGAEYVWNDDGNTTQWVQPAGIPGPQGLQGIQGISGNTGPQGPQGDAGFSNLYVTTGITASTQTLTTGFTYYGIIHTGNVDLTLPSPIGNDGFNLNIKDESGNSGIYRIRITTPSGSIDGNNYVDMNINYMSLHFVARNNNWWLI